MKQLWVELYRPKTIDDYVWRDQDQKAQVEQWIKEKSIPHILLSGSPGVGKTTLAKILINEIGVEKYDVLEANGSKEGRKIEWVDKLINFCQTVPFGPFKVVLIDEADYLNVNSVQPALRNLMEQYSDSVRFILTCNYPNKIIPAIHSRSQGFHVEKIDHTEFTARCATILVTEGVEFDLDTLDVYVTAAYPDLRKCINTLQMASVGGKLSNPKEASANTVDYRIKMVDLFKAGKLSEARKIACANVRPDEMEEMFRWMYDNLHLWAKTPEGQDQAIIKIRDGLVNHSLVADTEINLAATLVELTTIEE
jgi:DNA polymerase III delta prime subunit